jgi:hypothetical protein
MSNDIHEPNAAAADSGDTEMGGIEEDPYAELSELNALDALYYYAFPTKVNGETQEDREVAIRAKIDPMIEKDLEKYNIEEAPDDIGANAASANLKIQARHQWRLDRLGFTKRKAILAYGLKDLEHIPDGEELENLLSELEDREEEYEIDAWDRKPSMTDEDWSNHKHKRIQDLRSNSDFQKQKEKREEEDAMEDEVSAEQQKLLQQKAADTPEAAAWRPVDTKIHALRVEERPLELYALHKNVAALVLKWWESKPEAQDLGTCNAINTQLNYLANGDRWKFAPSDIDFWQTKLRESLSVCERAAGDHGKLLDLAHYAITFTNTLRKMGLDWKMVASMEVHRRVFMCLRSSNDAKVMESTEELEKAYFTARTEQIEVLSAALPVIVPLMHKNGQTNENTLSFCQESFQHLNKTLGKRNISLGLPRTDHYIPIADIEDAVRYYREGRSTEAENSIANMLYKIDLLGIPGFHEMKRGTHFDQKQARAEALNISMPKDMSQFIMAAPSLKRVSRQRAYPDANMTTVAWGQMGTKFYINQYGSATAPIFRKERYMSTEWASDYMDREPPIEYKVSIPLNRYGDERDRVTGKKVYGQEHIVGIYGVAFTEAKSSHDPLELIHPETYSLDNPRRPDRWNNDYVLIGWDLDLNKLNVVKRWEPRTVLRERLGKDDADEWIYESALEAQQRFDRARGVVKPSRGVSSKAAKNRHGTNSKTTATTKESISICSDADEEDESDSEYEARSRSSVAIRGVQSGAAIRDFLAKCSENNQFSAKERAAMMCQRFGEGWPDMLLT